VSKPNTPLPFLRDWPDEEPDVDISNLGPDDGPELTDELAAKARFLSEIPEEAEFAEFIRKGGRPAPPEKYRKAVTLLLDDEVIEHFKTGGEGWMERMSAALRKAAGL
jgi:uncharacterized protein (DUF4415 family)